MHRVNTIEDLKATPQKYGIEVDLRSNGSDLIIHHDPFSKGTNFNKWLEYFKHGTLILNVKEEGLESELIQLMSKSEIENYFFLDQSFPFIIKYANLCKGRSAVRFSEYENLETALAVSKMISWIWIDCFTKFPLDKINSQKLQQANFRFCLVSPELHGRDPETEIPKMFSLLSELHISPDAICTKFPHIWGLSNDIF